MHIFTVCCAVTKVDYHCTYLYQTPLDKQELLCGQLVGVSRCVSELSSSPVRVLRLRCNKFAVRMKDDFFWVSEPAGGPAAAAPDISDLRFHVTSFLNMNISVSCQALGCSVEVPTVSVCELLDQLINLFCFYNGSVLQSYQVQHTVFYFKRMSNTIIFLD